MGIGDNIRYYRERLGISQAELARRVGKTGGAISQYESGKFNPRMPLLESIADALGVPTYRLMGSTPDSSVYYEMVRVELTQDEEDLVELYRSMPKEKREQLMRIARSL